MTQMTTLIKNGTPVLLLVLLTLFVSCTEEPTTPPVADFSYEVSETNSLEVTFTDLSQGAETYSWDFGDNTGTSTDTSPTYTYENGGNYTVTLTVSNQGGSDEGNTDLEVIDPSAINMLEIGTFDDATAWTVINHYEATNLNGMVTIADGIARWTETTNADWKHMGIYTSITLEPGTYKYDMEVTFAGIADIWGEAYVGSNAPEAGSDYGTDQGATLIMKAYNAWECATEYTGLASEFDCDTSTVPGQFEISTAGLYYIVFRSGGLTYGEDGIAVDNLTLYKLN